MPSVTNATAEIAAADDYPQIRLFTVGTGAASRCQRCQSLTPSSLLQVIATGYSSLI